MSDGSGESDRRRFASGRSARAPAVALALRPAAGQKGAVGTGHGFFDIGEAIGGLTAARGDEQGRAAAYHGESSGKLISISGPPDPAFGRQIAAALPLRGLLWLLSAGTRNPEPDSDFELMAVALVGAGEAIASRVSSGDIDVKDATELMTNLFWRGLKGKRAEG